MSQSDVQPTQDCLPMTSPSQEAISLPSFVDHIDLNSIAFLATAIRKRTASTSVACTVNPLPKAGSYNVVWFIDFEDDVHWVFRTPQVEWSPLLEKRMRSDIITMKLIQSRTSIPIPFIHDFSVDINNVFGRPYIFFDCVVGTQLSELWYDPKWFTDERRKNVFRSLVSCMAQLRNLEFPSIGCVDYDAKTDSHVVGPLLDVDHVSEGNRTTTVCGPYSSVHAYLIDKISRRISATSSTSLKSILSMLRLFAGALPDETLDGPPFVLSMPDYGYQNVFVDDDGNVTGLIDWDGVQTCPRQGGYARYPPWITGDWDPTYYGYPDSYPVQGDADEGSCTREDNNHDDFQLKEESRKGDHNQLLKEEGSIVGELGNDNGMQASQSLPIPLREELWEDSPIVLQKFRDEYLQEFEGVDGSSANYTRNSHIYEAIDIGISSFICRHGIVCRLVEYVFGHKRGGGALLEWELEEGLGRGEWVRKEI